MNYKVKNENQVAIIKYELSTIIPNNAFGSFIREILFDKSTKLDYSYVVNTIVRHFPELEQKITECLTKYDKLEEEKWLNTISIREYGMTFTSLTDPLHIRRCEKLWEVFKINNDL